MRAWSPEEMRRFYSLRPKNWWQLRDLGLLNLGTATGMRGAEMGRTTLQDYTWEGGRQQFLQIGAAESKGRQAQIILLPWRGLGVFRSWLEYLRANGHADRWQPVFPSRGTGWARPMGSSAMWKAVTRLCRAASVELERSGAHSMRKTFAMSCWRWACRREEEARTFDKWTFMMVMLRHRSIEATKHYMATILGTDVASGFQAAGEAQREAYAAAGWTL